MSSQEKNRIVVVGIPKHMIKKNIKVKVKPNIEVRTGHGIELIPVKTSIPTKNGPIYKIDYIPRVAKPQEVIKASNHVNQPALAQWLGLLFVPAISPFLNPSLSGNTSSGQSTISVLNNGSTVVTLNANVLVYINPALNGFTWIISALDTSSNEYQGNSIQLNLTFMSGLPNFNVVPSSGAYTVPSSNTNTYSYYSRVYYLIENFAVANLTINKTSTSIISILWTISFSFPVSSTLFYYLAYSPYNPICGLLGSTDISGLASAVSNEGFSINFSLTIGFGYSSPSGINYSQADIDNPNGYTGANPGLVYFDDSNAYLSVSWTIQVGAGTYVTGISIYAPYVNGSMVGTTYPSTASGTITCINSELPLVIPVQEFQTPNYTILLSTTLTFIFTPTT